MLGVDGAWRRGRTSLRTRRARLRARSWQVAQCAVAAGVAWFIASDLLGHTQPVFAPIAAVVALGTSYAQRLRRVGEVTAGVAIGVLLADLLVALLGDGAWQMVLVVGLAMTLAIVLDGGTLFVNQAAIQAVFVLALVPGTGASFTRWTDALIGGGVALVAATVVPSAPLRRPRDQAAVVTDKISELLRGAAEVLREGDPTPALELLADARQTDPLVRQLQVAAAEGMAVASSSPFRVRHRPGIRRMADLVEPLDRALRSTRVLVRHAAVACYRDRDVPASYVELLEQVARAADIVGLELRADRTPVAARPALVGVAVRSGEVERAEAITAEALLVQARAVVVDLLMVTGMTQLDATDTMPPTR
ncbi:MAG: hypothetical protein CMH83_04365 [Nocardioides sp.]|nr:hypothetical protein [Nocardioides sp.]